MRKTTLPLLLVLALLLTPALAEPCTVVETPVFRESLTAETLPLRYYADHPHVPCLGLGEFYRLMLGSALSIRRDGAAYIYTAPDGATAALDPEAGTLSAPDFPRFFNLMDSVMTGMDGQYLDLPAFALPEGLDYASPAPVTLDLAKYRIPLHAETGDVCLPLATLSDLFTNLSYIYVSFNGETVYVNADNLLAPAWRRDSSYADPIYSQPDRAPDLAEFAYDELCFAVDTFYGYPGRAPLNDALARYGLDGALQAYSDASRRCRELLRSDKLGAYAQGANLLSALLDDGGHSGLDFTEFYADKPEFADFAVDYYMAAESTPADSTAALRRRGEKSLLRKLRQKRQAAWGQSHYFEQGDTAVIWFDTFMYDFDGWKAYYDGSGPRPQKDAMARVIDGLDRAAANPEIRNVVLDVSCNSGGSADMVVAVMSLIADAPEFPTENLLIGRRVTHKYRVDRNFDGVFDDRDKDVRYDFNFGVLTSPLSFSCANLLPSLMKDRGMPVLGQTSGGGTCAVAMHATPEGFVYQLSTALARLTDAQGNPIDDGVAVDVWLEDEAMYDIGAIGKGMEEFYRQ